MKRILIIQNCRIGDIVQSTTMLRGLKERYPGCHISMLINTLFSEINLGNELLDEVINFDQNKLHEILGDESVSLVRKYDVVKAFVEKFKGPDYDLVINLPSDENGHILASLVAPLAKEMRGGMYTKDRVLVLKHRSIMLLYTIPKVREYNRFNLIDLHNLIGEVRPKEKRLYFSTTPEGERFAERLFAENNIEAGDFVVALQAGASEERKRWSAKNFAQLADQIGNRLNARVLLCGSRSESALGDMISRMGSYPVVNLVGRTTLSALAAVLKRCSLLVTNDTGTMHIAKAMGTRVIDLSTGPVHFRETGPYGEGDVVIQGDIPCFPCNFDAVCHHLSCRDLITPKIVFNVVQALKEGVPLRTLNRGDFQGVKIYSTYFNDVGRLEFLPAFSYPINANEILSFLYAHLWEVFYGLREKPLDIAELFERIESAYDLGEVVELRAQCGQTLSYFQHVSERLAQARRLLKDILTIDRPDQRALVSRLVGEVQKIYGQLSVFGAAYPQVRPLTLYLRLAIDSQDEGSIRAVAKDYLTHYQWVSDQTEFMISSLRGLINLLDNRHANKVACSY